MLVWAKILHIEMEIHETKINKRWFQIFMWISFYTLDHKFFIMGIFLQTKCECTLKMALLLKENKLQQDEMHK